MLPVKTYSTETAADRPPTMGLIRMLKVNHRAIERAMYRFSLGDRIKNEEVAGEPG